LQSYPVELLLSMLKTYSPSGSEQRLADLLLKYMLAHGFNARKDRVGNVIGELGSEGPNILLCGHMDTVPGEIPVRIEGDQLYGRGAVDAKSSLAAMLFGSSLARDRSPFPFRVTVAGVVEEERSSVGAKEIIASPDTYDLAVFGEPSGASNIVIGYKGSLSLQVTCITQGGHSASPWLSQNSYEEAYEFSRALGDSFFENDSPSKFSVVTGCITGASAGNGSNTIPTQTTLDMDIRVPPDLPTAQLASKIAEFAKRYEASHQDVRVLVDVKDQTEAFVGTEDSLAVRAFRWAIRKAIGGPVTLVKKTGTSDANLFAQSCSIPMVVYGPGDSALDHTENENVSIREYLSTIEVYARAIQQFAFLAGTGNVTFGNAKVSC
jgi:LysW-gamma-L-lysine carboxypeptidase